MMVLLTTLLLHGCGGGGDGTTTPTADDGIGEIKTPTADDGIGGSDYIVGSMKDPEIRSNVFLPPQLPLNVID